MIDTLDVDLPGLPSPQYHCAPCGWACAFRHPADLIVNVIAHERSAHHLAKIGAACT